MASMRRVRKNFRKEVLRTISTGDGNIETLIEIAGKHPQVRPNTNRLIPKRQRLRTHLEQSPQLHLA